MQVDQDELEIEEDATESFYKQISGVDRSISDLRELLIQKRIDVSKGSVAPNGAYIYEKKIQKETGKIYRYWFVRGYDPDNPNANKSLGSINKRSKKLVEYRKRIERRSQLHAIDTRLAQIENYLRSF
jgi:hypothetical protein